MTDKFWTDRFNADKKVYSCPWCERDLKSKVSNSAKNPGKSFVSCSKDYGGCGLFCFLDAKPDDKYKPVGEAASKRAKIASEGTNVIGPVANQPDVHERRLAELATAIDSMRSELAKLNASVAMLLEQ